MQSSADSDSHAGLLFQLKMAGLQLPRLYGWQLKCSVCLCILVTAWNASVNSVCEQLHGRARQYSRKWPWGPAACAQLGMLLHALMRSVHGRIIGQAGTQVDRDCWANIPDLLSEEWGC